MGRGKIEIKRIENATNRQVTYSKRRTGIMKKAEELTVLCDAQVSLLMFSTTNKLHEYISPSITQKEFYDKYQRSSGVNLWDSQYEKMQENLKKLKETNNRLRKEIRQRHGEDLEGLQLQQLCGLEQNMLKSAERIRHKKFHVLGTQTETCKKKIKSHLEAQSNLLRGFEEGDTSCHYGFIPHGDDYDDDNGGSHVFAFRLQPTQPSLQDAEAAYGSYALTLA
nr:APETALA3-2 [Clematis patens]